MLVLSRKPGEKIHIGNSITITIVRIGPNTVRLGIDAPRDTPIIRDELVQLARALNNAEDRVEIVDQRTEGCTPAA